MADELKPCPFCGCRNVETAGYEDDKFPYLNSFWVRCNGCGALGSGKNTKGEAAEAWNKTSMKVNASEIPAEKLELALNLVVNNLADCSDMLMDFAESLCGEGAALKALKDKVKRL